MFKVRDAEVDSKCLVCLDISEDGTLELVTRQAWSDGQAGVYAFPVCSLICAGDLADLLRAIDIGDRRAYLLVMEMIREHSDG